MSCSCPPRRINHPLFALLFLASVYSFAPHSSRADAVTDWEKKLADSTERVLAGEALTLEESMALDAGFKEKYPSGGIPYNYETGVEAGSFFLDAIQMAVVSHIQHGGWPYRGDMRFIVLDPRIRKQLREKHPAHLIQAASIIPLLQQNRLADSQRNYAELKTVHPRWAAYIFEYIRYFLDVPAERAFVTQELDRERGLTNGAPISATIRITVEDDASTSCLATLKRIEDGSIVKTWQLQPPAVLTLQPGELPDGGYQLLASAYRHQEEYIAIRIDSSRVHSRADQIRLSRKRFAVLRYACNHSGGRSLQPPQAKEKRVVAGPRAIIPDLSGNWLIMQRYHRSTQKPVLFMRLTEEIHGFGVMPAESNMTFERLLKAPAPWQYGSPDREISLYLRPGLLLTSHIPDAPGVKKRHAKIEILDVTDTPPDDLPLFE